MKKPACEAVRREAEGAGVLGAGCLSVECPTQGHRFFVKSVSITAIMHLAAFRTGSRVASGGVVADNFRGHTSRRLTCVHPAMRRSGSSRPAAKK
jgi:hypothetical protein